jgi:transcriptional regulator with XRE-family HTH domain
VNISAEEIVKYRKSKGLSQEDLASILGVSKNTVYNYERGEKIPDSKIQILYKTINDTVIDVVSDTVKDDEFTTLIIDKLFSSDKFKQMLEGFIIEKLPTYNDEELQKTIIDLEKYIMEKTKKV